MMVRAVVPPTVPIGTQRVRICLHAANTLQDIKRLVNEIDKWCEGEIQEKFNGARAASILGRL